jgi:hypothetical protein
MDEMSPPPRKKAKVGPIGKDSSLRGITMGSITANANCTIVTTPCVLVSRSFPSWLLVVDELRLTPHAVLLEEATYVAAIRALVPVSCQIRVGDYSHVQIAPLGKTAVLLVDGGLTAKLASLCQGWRISGVIHTRQQRQYVGGAPARLSRRRNTWIQKNWSIVSRGCTRSRFTT